MRCFPSCVQFATLFTSSTFPHPLARGFQGECSAYRKAIGIIPVYESRSYGTLNRKGLFDTFTRKAS